MKNASLITLLVFVIIMIGFMSCGRVDMLAPALLGALKGGGTTPVDSLSLPPPPEELGFMTPIIQRSGSDSETSINHFTNKIVFVSSLSGTRDIWSANSNGTSPLQLTSGDNNDSSPVWNSDGSLIAFTSDSAGVQDIWTMDAAGGNLTVLTSDSTNDIMPAFNPSGTQVAFVSDRSGNLDIWIMPVGGGDAEQITTGQANDFRPSWSPDGSIIAFISDRTGTKEIWTVNVKSLEIEQFTNTGYEHDMPSWSPTGKYLAYAAKKEGNWDILIKEYGRVIAPIQATISLSVDTGPAWLPLETGLICSSSRGGDLDIYSMIFFEPLGQ